jgi:hypothetical protein
MSKGEISDYEYKLELEQCRYFTRNAPTLAANIRNNKFKEVLRESGGLALKQTAQLATGKIAGRAADYVGTRIGTKVGEAGIELAERGYRAVGRVVSNAGENLVFRADTIADTTFNISWELTNFFSGGTGQIPPELKIAMESQEFVALFKLINIAKGESPDKLMQAALYHVIKNVSLAKDKTDEDYREAVMIAASHLATMTQAGGSTTSMWKDVNELAAWLAAKAGRALPQESSGEVAKLEVKSFIADGSFIILDDPHGVKARSFIWDDNTITLNMNNYKVSGSGTLVYDEAGTGYHWDVTFYFDALFIDTSETNRRQGYFKDGKVLIVQNQSDSPGENKKETTFKGNLDGKVISGEIAGWLEGFTLDLTILNGQTVD